MHKTTISALFACLFVICAQARSQSSCPYEKSWVAECPPCLNGARKQKSCSQPTYSDGKSCGSVTCTPCTCMSDGSDGGSWNVPQPAAKKPSEWDRIDAAPELAGEWSNSGPNTVCKRLNNERTECKVILREVQTLVFEVDSKAYGQPGKRPWIETKLEIQGGEWNDGKSHQFNSADCLDSDGHRTEWEDGPTNQHMSCRIVLGTGSYKLLAWQRNGYAKAQGVQVTQKVFKYSSLIRF